MKQISSKMPPAILTIIATSFKVADIIATMSAETTEVKSAAKEGKPGEMVYIN